MSFEQFVCWDRAGLGLIEMDAVDTPKAMFLATHEPMLVWNQEYGRDGTRHLVNEEAVLEAFDHPRTTPLLMPIIGPSGSGKSHLVRWLRYSLPEHPDHLVIWIRRDRTSLADVVEELLEAIPTNDADLAEAVAGLRQQLSEAVAVTLSETELRRRLLQDLALHVRRLAPANTPYTDAQPRDRWEFLIKHDVGLPIMLDDPTFQEALIADGSLIARLAARIQRGRSGDQSGQEPLFTVNDLAPEMAASGDMSRRADALYKRLQRPHERQLAEMACAILNDLLERVVQGLMGFTDAYGRPTVKSIMVSLRRLLASEGKELILLIEDLALLHGVQGELLEALITPRTGEATHQKGRPQGELCQVRAAMAVTTNPWHQLEQSITTLRTRLVGWQTPLFDLDVSLETSGDAHHGVPRDDTRRFVAGYLNAVRLGQDRLEKHLERWEKRSVGAPFETPSACDKCPYQDDCHAAFGANDGRGYYPLAESTLDRLVEREARLADGRFDPRQVLRGLQKILDVGLDEIPTAEFPSTRVREDFVDAELAMPEPTAQMLRRADEPSADRRRTLLELWGPRPFRVQNLDDTIHGAFAIPPLAGTATHGDATESEEADATSDSSDATTSAEARKRAAIESQLDQIERWGRGDGQLSDHLAGALRGFVFEAVMSRVEWELLSDGRSDTLLQDLGIPDASRTVSIEASRGDDRVSRHGPPLFVVKRDRDGVRLLRALFQLNALNHWKFDDALDGLLHVPHVLDGWAGLVEERLRARAKKDHGLEVNTLMRALAVSGRVLALEGSVLTSAAASALACAVADAPDAPTSKMRTPEWERLERAARGERGEREFARTALLRRLGRSQGSGDSVALDTLEVIDALRKVTGDWKLESAELTGDSEFKRWVDNFAAALKGVDAEWQARVESARTIAEQLALPDGQTLAATANAVEATSVVIDQVAGQHGDDTTLVLALKELRGLDDAKLRAQLEIYAADGNTPWTERFRRAAAFDASTAERTILAVRMLSMYLDDAESMVTAKQEESGAADALTNATTAITDAIDKLGEALKNVAD